MVWNASKPANTEKIRDLGNVIQPNWKAIEQASDGDADADKLRLWASNLTDRALIAGSNTPNRIDNTGQIYCRNDGDENELFFMDSQDPSKELQISRDGRLGVVAQGINASNLQFDIDATFQPTFGINQMVIASGSFNSSGTLLNGINMATGTNLTQGDYTVNINADVVLNSNYKVLITCSGANRVASVTSKAVPAIGIATVITIRIVTPTNGSNQDSAFDIIVIGGR